MKREILDLEALLRAPLVDADLGLSISPDGRRVAYSTNASGRWEIWALPLDGSAPPQQVSSGPGSKFAPRWAPDGRRLAYLVDLDGGELFDIYVYDWETGAQLDLTPDTPDAIQPGYSWSPDGTQLAFVSDRSGRFDTYVMDAAPGAAARCLFALPYSDTGAYWSPDGRWMAVRTETSGQDHETYLVPVDGGEPRLLAEGDAPLHAHSPYWSPDSARVAFASDLHGSFDVGVYELATGQVTWVTRSDDDAELPCWSPDGRRLAYVVSAGPLNWLAVQEWPDGALSTYQVEPGVHYRAHWTPDGAALIVPFDNPRHPTNLWRLSLADGAWQPLTRSLPSEIDPTELVLPEQVRYPSLDGQSVPALLFRPPGVEGPAPAVVYVHGGPTWLSQVTWNPLIQHMLSRGWAVLEPNYRGSTGYGRAWQTANRFVLGDADTQDVVAGADYLVREGLADAARVAVTGTSYGGYMTMTSLTRYPDRWAAGSAVVPFLNWFTEYANERPDLQHWDHENFGDPEQDRHRFTDRSPFFFLDRVQAPVQLICGANDPRCPASESIQARDALLAAGKRCDFVLYPDEGHQFLKIENAVDAKLRRVAFLAEVLDG